ncbi:hypothetical protein PENTCL1PPCAC_12183, partial [Pristionchus entomophagus]
MDKWAEVIPDTILVILFIYMLFRLATSSEAYFKTPFYVLFLTTDMYSIISILTYLIIVQFLQLDKTWSEYIYKASLAVTTFGAIGSTIGKAFIAIHRYFVMRTNDFSEKKFPTKVIWGMLFSQFVISVAVTTPVWLSSTFTMKNDVIVNLSKENTVIMKAISVIVYIAYILCNSICTMLTSRELIRLRQMLEGKSSSTAIIAQQRNMFIVVSVCSITHLIKAIQQVIFDINENLFTITIRLTISIQYPLVNGLASYAAPLCLVIFSSKVRARLFFRKPAKHTHSITAVSDIVLVTLYTYLLIRLATSSDRYFKKPFYTFFKSTGQIELFDSVVAYRSGVYSITSVVSFIFIEQFSYAANVFGASGATFGKAFIAIHRYFVMRNRDFTE